MKCTYIKDIELNEIQHAYFEIIELNEINIRTSNLLSRMK